MQAGVFEQKVGGLDAYQLMGKQPDSSMPLASEMALNASCIASACVSQLRSDLR